MDETETLTQKVEPLLEEGTRLEITESRLPNTGQGRPFVEINSRGLTALHRNTSYYSTLAVARTDYGSYPISPEDWE